MFARVKVLVDGETDEKFELKKNSIILKSNKKLFTSTVFF